MGQTNNPPTKAAARSTLTSQKHQQQQKIEYRFDCSFHNYKFNEDIKEERKMEKLDLIKKNGKAIIERKDLIIFGLLLLDKR